MYVAATVYGTAQMQRPTRSQVRCSNLDYSQYLSLEMHAQNLRESRHKLLEISVFSSDRAVGCSHSRVVIARVP